MNDKQPDALKWADAVEHAYMPVLGEFLRTQHATIESMTVVLDGQHAAIERKDALLSKCMKHVASNISMTSDGTEAEDLYDAIQRELLQ